MVKGTGAFDQAVHSLGGSFLFVEVALRHLPPLIPVLLGVSFGAAALWLLVILGGLACVDGRLFSFLGSRERPANYPS